MTNQKGFTIVELIVVVATIAVLAAIVLTNVNQYTAKARDAKRMTDLKQIRIALQMYYEQNGGYPVIARWATSEVTTYDSGARWASLQTALAPYLSKLPGDPRPIGTGGPWTTGTYHYAYSSDGQIYDLVAQLEGINNPNTCQYKCWRYHQGEGASWPVEGSYCNSAVCSGGSASIYMYADH
jgi:general secretion pathway protein G